MNKKELLLHEIEAIPEPILDEVMAFVQFLQSRISAERLYPALASEAVLKRDWLSPEEDEAWRDL